MSSRFLSVVAVSVVGLFIASACGSENESEFGSSGGSSGFNGSSSGSIGGSSGSSGDLDELAACATETLKGEALPLDIHIMLDASGSMMGAVQGNKTKWTAVKDALKGFIGDPNSAGVGVGLQIFPIVHAGAPASCVQDSDCPAGFGSCILKACDYAAFGALLPCDSASECPNNAACLDIREYKSGGQDLNCLVGSTTPGLACPAGAKALTASQCSKKECFAEDYDDARIPIGLLPGAAGTLTSNIDGIPNPPNTALTPTSVAVQGGITFAKAHKAANPEHAVVLVLATDGLPTRCSPYESAAIATLAAAGLPDVKTFVVGVFSPAEQATAKPNLDNIAKGGGTNSALIVSTNGNVTADFQKAMDQIRGAALPCDYKVPTPQSGTPDYGRVNVKFTKGDGTASVFPQAKGGASACDASGGWYYDVDPSTGGTPTKITLCPASCDAVKASGSGSKVDVLLGCQTIVK
jgi:hypothetical protein